MSQQPLSLFDQSSIPDNWKSQSEEKIYSSPLARPQWITDTILDDMLSLHRPQKMPQGFAEGEKTSYSPTMLEAFSRCPYGWFIDLIADIKPSFRARTQQGGDMHSLVDFAGQFGLEAAEEKLFEDAYSNRQENLLMLRRIYQKYFVDWPAAKARYSEKKMTLNLPSGHQIGGRADRIDLFEEGALVIDWKLKCSTKPSTAQKRTSQKQRYLYPLMAAQSYGYEPLGMVYVSLQDNNHEGSMQKPIKAIDNGSIDYNWKEEAKQAVADVMDLIEEMENGLWWRQGEHCAEWCGCKRENRAKARWC